MSMTWAMPELAGPGYEGAGHGVRVPVKKPAGVNEGVDGTLLLCWSWRAHSVLYSGKHKTTGMNVQVSCTITGCLAWISDPIPGSRHDHVIERVIANFKTRRIMHTDYRRPLATFPETISAVVALHFYTIA
jgi:hypothetical protein